MQSAKKQKKKAEPGALGAAVHLLSAIVDSSEGSTYALKLRLLGGAGDFFNYCFSVSQLAAASPESTSAESMASLLLRCVHMNASVAVTRLTLDPAETADLEEFVVWMSSNIIASACDAAKSAHFHQAATVAVMALFSDCLVLNVATRTAETALDSWASSLLEYAKDGGDVSYLIPVIGRICSLGFAPALGKTASVTMTSAALSTLQSLWEILLMHLSAREDDVRPRRLVDGILRGPGDRSEPLTTSIQFVLSKIKIVEKRGVAKMKIDDDNALICLEIIKETQLVLACELTQKMSSTEMEEEKGMLLIADLIKSSGTNNPVLKKQIYDGLVKNSQDKENSSQNLKMAALMDIREDMEEDMEEEEVM